MERKEAFDVLTKQLPKGCFLTVKNGEDINTMIIGWATEGVVWGKDVLTVMVRFSRHTYDLIKDSDSFSVSIPKFDSMKKEIGFCGTKSGAEFDKFKKANLTLKDSRRIDSPVINECEVFYECKIIYKQAMEPMGIIDDEGINQRYYNNNDFHVIFYGEIMDFYSK